jgi:hypothetical protein
MTKGILAAVSGPGDWMAKTAPVFWGIFVFITLLLVLFKTVKKFTVAETARNQRKTSMLGRVWHVVDCYVLPVALILSLLYALRRPTPCVCVESSSHGGREGTVNNMLDVQKDREQVTMLKYIQTSTKGSAAAGSTAWGDTNTNLV